MLVRLKIQGFKSLYDTEIRFGPFTCIAGANGVGKSNLFDALAFLRDLSKLDIAKAASLVRDPSGKDSDPQALFTHVSDPTAKKRIRFEADVLVAGKATDDLGREATPKSTFLRYVIEIGYRPASDQSADGLELCHESLVPIGRTDARELLGFAYNDEFFDAAVVSRRRVPFISTEQNSNPAIMETGDAGKMPVRRNRIAAATTIVKLHQDSDAGGGRATLVDAKRTPRSVLSSVDAEYPTALAVKQEMQSWFFLHMEPTALRNWDDFGVDDHIAPNGAHLPTALHRLSDKWRPITNRLNQLLQVNSVVVDSDEKRRTRTLMVAGQGQQPMPAKALSDGTLRFLVLSTLAEDPTVSGLIAFEEPENGIHPARIPNMLSLLKDIAVSTHDAVGEDNPLRQVIINTHSPRVVEELESDDLVIASAVHIGKNTFTRFECESGSWRAVGGEPANASLRVDAMETTSRGVVLRYLFGGDHPMTTDKSARPTSRKLRDVYRDVNAAQLSLPGIDKA